MKTVIVGGMENSGTKMLFWLLKQHPDINASHISMPGGWMPDTHMPNMDDCDRVAWIIRYEPFRLSGVKRRGYDLNRPDHFVAPGLYNTCLSTYRRILSKTTFIPYEGIVGPFQSIIMDVLMTAIGVTPYDFDYSDITDENLKYLT